MNATRPYVGRFAPSPTGRLHLGSMVAAVASYLDARAHGGLWLVRMEDLDPPREVQGAADDMLRTLEGFGLEWDGTVMYQSRRHEAYRHALDRLLEEDLAFGCVCSRKALAEAGGLEVYPGWCRDGLPVGTRPRLYRFRMPPGPDLNWVDRIHGPQSVARKDVGDVVLLRADGHWAYHLAVVVDDAEQGVTDVVRGADLLSSTAAHIALQNAWCFPSVRYAHVEVVTNSLGQKLSKQTRAAPVEVRNASDALRKTFQHLGLPEVTPDNPATMLREAQAHWKRSCDSL
jgi:glutamyl-Q tRNA(Asp) synthetase